MQKVLVIGGLGFIGYHTVAALRQSGYEPVIGSRSGKSDVNADAPIIAIDLQTMSDDALKTVLSPFYAVIFAGGADDRTMPKEAAAPFFYKEM